MSGRTLRVGVVGAGFIGRVHAEAARRAGASSSACPASTPATTKDAVERLGAERGFVDADELVVSPDIDVVHICTPNHLHGAAGPRRASPPASTSCARSPSPSTMPEATELCAAADAAGVVATVPFVYRFYPMVREARVRVTADPGPVRLVHGAYLQDWLSTEDDDNWRVDAALSGRSRAFADIGSHWCDLVEFVTGDRLASVCAELVTALPRRLARDAHAHAFESSGEGDRPSPRRHDRGHRRRHVPHGGGCRRLAGGQPDLVRPQEPAPLRGDRQ